MASYHYSSYCLPSTLAAMMILFQLFMSIKRWHIGNRVKVLTFLLSQSLLVMISETLLITANTPELTLFWDKMMYVGIILYPASLFHINLAYGKKVTPFKHWFIIYIPPIIFLSLLPTDLFIAGVEPTYWGWGKVVGPGFAWYQAYAGTFLVTYCVSVLYQFFTEPSPRLKNEILCLAITTLPTVFIGCIIIIVLTLLHITKFNIIVHAICVLWHCITISIAMLSKRFYDVYAHLPWFSFEKKQLQKNVAELIQSGTMPLDHERIVETLNKLFRVDIAIHTATDVYANHGCDPVFAEFSTETLFRRSEVLIRHELSPKEPEYQILARYKCDLLAPLFLGGRFIGAVRIGAGLTDRLYSNYDITLIYTLLSQLRLALVYVSIVPQNPATVVLHQLRGKVCSVQKTGDVRIYVVDYENRSVTRDEDADTGQLKHLPGQPRPVFNPAGVDSILDEIQLCPVCDSRRIYTAINMTCIFDHQKKQIIEVAETVDLGKHGSHGCLDCQHQWISATPSYHPPKPPNVINLHDYKSSRQ